MTKSTVKPLTGCLFSVTKVRFGYKIIVPLKIYRLKHLRLYRKLVAFAALEHLRRQHDHDGVKYVPVDKRSVPQPLNHGCSLANTRPKLLLNEERQDSLRWCSTAQPGRLHLDASSMQLSWRTEKLRVGGGGVVVDVGDFTRGTDAQR